MLIEINEYSNSYSYINLNTVQQDEFGASVINAIADYLSSYVLGYKYDLRFKNNLWDGKVNHYYVDDGFLYFPKGLAQALYHILESMDVELKYTVTTNKTEITNEEFALFIKNLNLPFEPYDFQYNGALKLLRDGRGVGISCTSSGKSFLIYIMMMYYRSKGLKSVLIVPTVSLVLQMYSDFESYGIKDIDKVHTISAGKEKHFNELVTITTYQSIAVIDRNIEKYGEDATKNLFSDVDALIVDECQGARSLSIQTIFMYNAINAKFRFGVTGTLPRDDNSRKNIIGAIGEPFKIISPRELIDRGLATPVFIKLLFLNYHNNDIKYFNNNKEIDEKTKKVKQYHIRENNFIHKHYNRNKIIVDMANKVSKSGNSFVMFKKKDHGRFLLRLMLSERHGINVNNTEVLEAVTPKKLRKIISAIKESSELKFFYNGILDYKKITTSIFNLIKKDNELFDDMFGKGQDKTGSIKEIIDKYIISLSEENVYIVYGEISPEQREEIRQILEVKDDCVVFGSMGTLATGVNVKNLKYLFLTHSIKEYVLLNQIIGRGMRLHDNKDKFVLFDCVDDLRKNKNTVFENYSIRHSKERIELYLENEYDIQEIEIQLHNDHIVEKKIGLFNYDLSDWT